MSTEYQKKYYIDNVKSKGLVKCELCNRQVQLKRLEYHKETNLCKNNRFENNKNKINKIKIQQKVFSIDF